MAYNLSPLVFICALGSAAALRAVPYPTEKGPGRRLMASVSELGTIAETVNEAIIVQSNGCADGETCNDCQMDSCTLAVGTPVVGPFEGGFGSDQDFVITGQFGVEAGSEKLCYSEGGLDVATAEAICSYNADVAGVSTVDTLPGLAGGNYYGLLDGCGGHTQYHFHRPGLRPEDPRHTTCAWTQSTTGHDPAFATVGSSTSLSGGGSGSGSGSGGSPTCCDGSTADTSSHPPTCDDGSNALPPGDSCRRMLQEDVGQIIYGTYEDAPNEVLPVLDACGGHFGTNPDSAGQSVYHYHIQEHAPFSLGCIGPNDDGSAVTVQQCRDLYDNCDDSGDVEVFTAYVDGVATDIPFQAYCPCYDASGQGAQGQGLNVGTVDASRGFFRREVDSNGDWSTSETGTFAAGTFANRDFSGGITIVDLATDSSSSCSSYNAEDNTCGDAAGDDDDDDDDDDAGDDDDDAGDDDDDDDAGDDDDDEEDTVNDNDAHRSAEQALAVAVVAVAAHMLN